MLYMTPDITLQPLASEIVMRLRCLTKLLAGDSGADLSLVQDALRNRSVSVASDGQFLSTFHLFNYILRQLEIWFRATTSLLFPTQC